MQGSSTFEVCEKSLYSQYSQYFLNLKSELILKFGFRQSSIKVERLSLGIRGLNRSGIVEIL